MTLVRRLSVGAGLRPQAAGATTVVEQLFNGMFSTETESGQHVSVERSFGLPPILRAIRLISETSGLLPLLTYRRDPDGNRERDDDQPSAELLAEEPNPGLGAVEFWTMLFNHLAGWGRMFIGKEFDGRGRLRALHPIEPRAMSVERLSNGQLVFHESGFDGRMRDWDQRTLIYVRLFTVDGVNGLSPIGLMRESAGFGLALRRHGARFFRDAAIPGGVLSVKEVITDPKVRERMRAEWRDAHKGKRDIAILDAEAKFQPVTVPLADAQFAELWGVTKADVADAFNMPPAMLGAPSGDTNTYGNREADMQQFLTLTLSNPLKKVEQAFTRDRDVFPRPAGRKVHFAEFLREELLRPDSSARAQFYRLALDPKWGWMDRSEVRRRENLPPNSEHDERQGRDGGA